MANENSTPIPNHQNSTVPTNPSGAGGGRGGASGKRGGGKQHHDKNPKRARAEGINETREEVDPDITPEMEFAEEMEDGIGDMPIDIGIGNREMLVDYSYNYRGIVIKKFSLGDETRKTSEIHLSKKVCESLLEHESEVLNASQSIEMGEHTSYNLDLGNNFIVQAESEGGFDVTHIRKVIRPAKRMSSNYGAAPVPSASSSGTPESTTHSNTGLTFKFGELNILFTIIKKVVGLLVGF